MKGGGWRKEGWRKGGEGEGWRVEEGKVKGGWRKGEWKVGCVHVTKQALIFSRLCVCEGEREEGERRAWEQELTGFHS